MITQYNKPFNDEKLETPVHDSPKGTTTGTADTNRTE